MVCSRTHHCLQSSYNWSNLGTFHGLNSALGHCLKIMNLVFEQIEFHMLAQKIVDLQANSVRSACIVLNLHPTHRRKRWFKEKGSWHFLYSLFPFSLLFVSNIFDKMPHFFLEEQSK